MASVPLPPCCAPGSGCRKIFSDNFVFAAIGRIGFKSFAEKRASVMLTAAIFSFVALIFYIVSISSLSVVNGTVKSTNWSYTRNSYSDSTADVSGDLDYYIGLREIVYKLGDSEDYYRWSNVDCPDTDDSDFCSDCKDACNNAAPAVIISFVTSFPTILCDLQRSTVKGDLNLAKVIGILTGIIGTIANLAALGTYATTCHSNLPDTITIYESSSYTYSVSVDWYYGAGFVCTVIATFLKPLDVILHILTPTPSAEELNSLNEKLIPAEKANNL